jgi:hypothetical protein
MREGRRIVLDNFPSESSPTELNHELYGFLHAFNIVALREFKFYPLRNSNMSGRLTVADLPTAEEAQRVCDTCHGVTIRGHKISIRISKPPMKYLGGRSWDQGLPGGHNRPRDMGSAVSTNFEKVGYVPTPIGLHRPERATCLHVTS